VKCSKKINKDGGPHEGILLLVTYVRNGNYHHAGQVLMPGRMERSDASFHTADLTKVTRK